MKHRQSFFLDPSRKLPRDAFQFTEGSDGTQAVLKIQHLHAAREWKITIDANELDARDLQELIKGDVTIQFAKETARNIPEPLQRGFVSGLHIFWDGVRRKVDNLPFVGQILSGLSPDSIHLPGNVSYLHLQQLPFKTIDLLFDRLSELISPGSAPLRATLAHADVIDFDILSPKTIQIRAVWASAAHPNGWRVEIPAWPDSVIEVGVFEEGRGEDKDEHALSGLRAIVGRNGGFEPTVFTFPHRHHIFPSVPCRSLLDPTYGSHPKLRTTIPTQALHPPINDTLDHETCNLHALYTLSKNVFVDKYQLAQLAQFELGGIQNVRGVWGETDLEAPSYKTEGWGSIVLVDIARIDGSGNNLTLELPLHLRYLEPLEGGGNREIKLLCPEIFWACKNDVEDFTLSPFAPPARSVLHTLFPSDTVFYHLSGHVTTDPYVEGIHQGVISLQVPVANASLAQLAQNLTGLGILMGFTYLFVKGVRVGIKGLRWRGKGKEKAKDL